MLLLWYCMLLVTLYLVAVNKCQSEAPKADNFAIIVLWLWFLLMLLLLLLLLMSLLWPCLLLLITLHQVVVNKCSSGVLKADVEFLWWVGRGGLGWWGGVQSHFCVQPNCSFRLC